MDPNSTNPNSGFSQIEDEQAVDIRLILARIISLWPYLIASVLVTMVSSWFYLRYTTPVYQTQATLFIESRAKGGMADLESAFKEFGFGKANTELDNELVYLESYGHALKTVEAWNVPVVYRSLGRLSKRESYTTSPVEIELDTAHVQFKGWIAELEFIDGQIEVEVKRNGRANKVG